MNNPSLETTSGRGNLAQMSFAEFAASVARDSAPPDGLSAALQALWHDARGAWDKAHACAQEDHSRAGSWVHAYLHRKEGDISNARYWYSKAHRPFPAEETPLTQELETIARELLGDAK
jgi:hypothetical protein